jgi:hypothetical protein
VPATKQFSRRSLLLVCVTSSTLSCSYGDDETRLPPIANGQGPELIDRVGVAVPPLTLVAESAETARARRAIMNRVASVGLRHIRGDVQWARIERQRDAFDWTGLDAVISDASSRNLRLLAYVAYGNPLYPTKSGEQASTGLPLDPSPAELFPPIDPNDYARFVTQLATRYQTMLAGYEFWNEPNIGYRFWRPGENAADFANLSAAATTAARRACPACTLMPGGLSMPQPVPGLKLYTRGDEFLNEMFVAKPDFADDASVVAFHPYQYPKDPPEFDTSAFATTFPENFQGSLQTQTLTMRNIVQRNRTDLPLWITENGWPTNPGIPSTVKEVARTFGTDELVITAGRDFVGEQAFAQLLETIRGVSEQAQANYLVRATMLGMAIGVERQYLYGVDDFPLEPEINQEAAFGMFRVDATEKPAAQAIRTMMQLLGGFRFVEDVTTNLILTPDDHVIALRADDGRAGLVFWRANEKSGAEIGEVTVTDLAQDAMLINRDGVVLANFTLGSSATIPLTPAPHYLILR